MILMTMMMSSQHNGDYNKDSEGGSNDSQGLQSLAIQLNHPTTGPCTYLHLLLNFVLRPSKITRIRGLVFKEDISVLSQHSPCPQFLL